jgi:hypothetical protein
VEYADLIADFSRRTLRNLDHVQGQGRDGNLAVYPVTQLWNSLLGLIVLPRERDVRRIPKTPMSELWAQGWPRLTTSGPETEHQSLHDLVSALRHAVAHFNVEFESGTDREISSVKLWNERFRTSERVWEGRISATELDRLARLPSQMMIRRVCQAAMMTSRWTEASRATARGRASVLSQDGPRAYRLLLPPVL